MPLKKAGLYTNTRKDVCYEVNYVGAVGSKLDLNCWGSICRVSVWRCDCVLTKLCLNIDPYDRFNDASSET